jgi:drug/metabolite transporter (DMT)-like permease
VPLPPRRSFGPVALGFASHLLAGVLPFVSAGAIGRLGLMPATATLYLAGSAALLVSLTDRRVRGWLRTETPSLAAPRTLGLLLGGLAGFLVAGVAYYIGLSSSPRVAEYIFLTRLDWLVQAAFAIVWLREPWTGRGLAGAVLALAGGLMLAWSGSFGTAGLLAAAAYIGASLVGYSCFKPLAVARGTTGAVVLTMWRHWVNTFGFVVLAAMWSGPPASGDGTGLMLALVAGMAIVVLFLLRFVALTGLPLWVLSAQAPTQALIAILATLATSGVLPGAALAAIGLIVAGEVLVSTARATA